MKGEYVIINGGFVAVDSAGGELFRLLHSNYTYRDIHIKAGRPLHPGLQLELLEISCATLFGHKIDIDRKAAGKWIGELLYRNRAPEGSNIVRAVVCPGEGGGEPAVCLFYRGPLMYKGLSLWHKPQKALPLTYEIPFQAFKTAANLLCHNYSTQHARRLGYDRAIAVNYAGCAVSLGEDPLFCVRGRKVFVADARVSIPQSVERLVGIGLCLSAGLEIEEQAVTEADLARMDEIFAFSPQGIIPVGAVGDRLLPSSLANLLADHLPAIEEKELEL